MGEEGEGEGCRRCVCMFIYIYGDNRRRKCSLWCLLPLPQFGTSSSAVAKRLRDERLRDASCLSVVSFSSTKRRAQSFIVSYMGHRFITAYTTSCAARWPPNMPPPREFDF